MTVQLKYPFLCIKPQTKNVTTIHESKLNNLHNGADKDADGIQIMGYAAIKL